MIITHNIQAANIMRQLGINQLNKSKTTEKLSSGYRINRAADNAAGLSISEKQRAQIRGLLRAAKNADEGISFVQTGDGAMNEMHSLLHRMRELAVQASNDTYVDADRAAMQMEFDHLQSEIDKINDQTEFNTLPVFEHYPDNYAIFEGNRNWSQNQPHVVVKPDNTLVITYEMTPGVEKEIELEVPEGVYTTQELMDEIDDVITAGSADGSLEDNVFLELTENGRCNLIIQDGDSISDVNGGLRYLFFNEYTGSNIGALIGTTEFAVGGLFPVTLENNELYFTIEHYDTGLTETTKPPITLPLGNYSRSSIIDFINDQLKAQGITSVTASEYGDSLVQIGGEDCIVTGLKGNMFLVELQGEEIHPSVFYDNTRYGSVKQIPAVFTGGNVLPVSDSVNGQFIITEDNNILSIKNKDGSYTEYKIEPPGNYSIRKMNDTLNTLLNPAGISVRYYSSLRAGTTPLGNTNLNFYGFILETSDTGASASIDFNMEDSTAYDTLFVNRRYADRGSAGSFTDGLDATDLPSINSARLFLDGISSVTLKNGENDTFKIRIEEQDVPGYSEYTIDILPESIDEMTFTTIQELADAINEQLNGANAPLSLKGNIQCIVPDDGNFLCIQATPENHTITKIYFPEDISTNEAYSKAYYDIFVRENISYSHEPVSAEFDPTAEPRPYFTKVSKITFPVTFTENNNYMDLMIGTKYLRFIFEPGVYPKQKFIDAINEQLKGGTYYTLHQYGTPTATDTLRQNASSSTGYATISSRRFQDTKTGISASNNGTTASREPVEAEITFRNALPAEMKITGNNDKMTITVSDRSYTIDIAQKTYTDLSELVGEINTKLSQKIAEAGRGDYVNVSLNASNQLVFKTATGGNSTLTIDSDSCSFFKDLVTTRSQRPATTNLPLNDSFTLDKPGYFECTVQQTPIPSGQTSTQTLQITFDAQPYDQTKFLKVLNGTLKNYNITANVNESGQLALTPAYSDSINTSVILSTSNAFSPNVLEKALNGLIHRPETSVTLPTNFSATGNTIDPDDFYNITVTYSYSDGEPTSISIPLTPTTEGTTRNLTDIVDEINNKLRTNPDITASPNDDGSIIFKMKNTSGETSISLSANATLGSDTLTIPDICAALSPDDEFIIYSAENFSAVPTEASLLVQPTKHVDYTYPERIERDLSEIRQFSLASDHHLENEVSINDSNNTLNFTYLDNGTPVKFPKTGSFTIPNKIYQLQELESLLQTAIDNVLGNDALSVSITNDGISITAKKYGSNYGIAKNYNYSKEGYEIGGTFYERFILGTVDQVEKTTPSNINGHQVMTDTYIVGRKDVNNNKSRIVKGYTNDFGLDLTMIDNKQNEKKYTINIDLTKDIGDGEYSAPDLVKLLQNKINEAFQDKYGDEIPPNTILVDVGKIETGVPGADDANALDFYLNPNVTLKEGTYHIDGLTGNSLFEIFYKTTGDPFPAFISGTKNLVPNVTIYPEHNELSFDVTDKDGLVTTYTYEIPCEASGKTYTTEEFIDMMNDLFDQPDKNGNIAPVEASLSGNALKISHQKVGNYQISNVQGSAKSTIFAATDSRKGYDSSLNIQVGANSGQMLNIKRHSLSTLSMRINSLTVSKFKYAQKALTRINEALGYLNSKRSDYGAKQNRLEHIVNGNNNTSENLQASESRMRDADLANEMVANARQDILEQAGMAMLAQANQKPNGVLQLLRQ